MLQELAQKIARWTAQTNYGRPPSRIRLNHLAIQQIKDDLRKLKLYPRMGGLDGMRILGVEVVEDNSIEAEQIDK